MPFRLDSSLIAEIPSILLSLYQLRHLFDQAGLVDLERNFRNNSLGSSRCSLLFAAGSYFYLSDSRAVCLSYAVFCPGWSLPWKIRSLDDLDQIFYGGIPSSIIFTVASVTSP